MASYFQIIYSAPDTRRSLILPASSVARGTAFMESSTAGTAALADGTKQIAGFVDKPVDATGLDIKHMVLPGYNVVPYKQGQYGTMEKAERFDAEGSDYIDSGYTAPALNDEITFSSGKALAATSTTWVEYKVVEVPTARDSGNVRIVCERISPGYKKA